MNETDLITAFKDETDLPKSEAESVENVFFNQMTSTLASGERAEIRGLCSFYVKNYMPYTGRNPKTGGPINIKPKNLPFFKCGKELKERVDK
jgi:integration host factor subunit beta